MNKLIVLAFLLFSGISNTVAQIKVACIGNSITAGHGLAKTETYPSQLAGILGDGWNVQNFGLSSTTLLRNGNFPYVKQKVYADAKAFAPDVVIIKLGTNDAKPQNWKFRDEFISDYNAMLNEIKSLPSRPYIILCLPVPAYGTNFQINDSIVNNLIVPMVREIASDNKLPLIDLHKAMSNHPEWFPDKIHPTAAGATEMAKVISRKLLKEKKKIRKRKRNPGNS
jgi:acyl-CoA thioesterase-1